MKFLTTKGDRERIVLQRGKRATEVIRLPKEMGLVKWAKGRGDLRKRKTAQ